MNEQGKLGGFPGESQEPPRLAVHCGEQTRVISPTAGEITLGRDPSSAIRLDHSWLSRTHVRLRTDGSRWIAVDCSRNGMFIDGVRHESVVVTEGLTLHLGNPDGLPVHFTFSDTEAGPDDDDWDAQETVDPDIARAGAAVAARRRELDLTQRGLARDKIINAGALIAFEKGRSWPHESTRARLEQVLQWPPGAIAGIRQGEPSPDEQEHTASTSTSVGSPLIAQAIQLALNSIDSSIAALPDETSPDFNDRVSAVLGDLRNLQAVTSDAARNAPGAPALVLVLGGVRRRYDELMTRAARAGDAPIGRRLYAARRRANLTTADTALAAGLPASFIDAIEADQPVPAHARAAIERVLGHLEV